MAARWRACLLFVMAIALIGGMAARQPLEMERLSRLAAVVTLGAVTSLFIFPGRMTEEIMAKMAEVLLGLAAALIRVAARAGVGTLLASGGTVTRLFIPLLSSDSSRAAPSRAGRDALPERCSEPGLHALSSTRQTFTTAGQCTT